MSIRYAFHHGNLPELTLTGDELALAGLPPIPCSVFSFTATG
ncbi:hypothetical protein [Pectobacterium versatile]|nr:hypothetical protein [Pectobacterium versatile]